MTKTTTWLPIESAPRDGTLIIVALTNSSTPVPAFFSEDLLYYWEGDFFVKATDDCLEDILHGIVYEWDPFLSSEPLGWCHFPQYPLPPQL